MSTKLTSLATAHYILLARSFVVIVGGLAVWWGIYGFPIFWQESSTERIANQVVAGDPFDAGILTRQLPIMNSIERSTYCRPAALRSAAIIQLRMVEAVGLANDRERSGGRLISLGKVIRSSLLCSPADPFLWVVLSWLENTQHGIDHSDLRYLRMSYRLGPNEGWIALKRNPIALANYSALSPDLAEAGISEFVSLIRSHFYSEAADIVAGPGRPIRSLLFAPLKGISDADRQAFAKLLYERGLDDIPVPGTVPPPQDPWHSNTPIMVK
jgi:hypothetical protein